VSSAKLVAKSATRSILREAVSARNDLFSRPAEKVSGTESIEWIQTVPDTFMPIGSPFFAPHFSTAANSDADRFPIFRPTFFDSSEFRMVREHQDQFVGGNAGGSNGTGVTDDACTTNE
jgi:hypothetical protein